MNEEGVVTCAGLRLGVAVGPATSVRISEMKEAGT